MACCGGDDDLDFVHVRFPLETQLSASPRDEITNAANVAEFRAFQRSLIGPLQWVFERFKRHLVAVCD